MERPEEVKLGLFHAIKIDVRKSVVQFLILSISPLPLRFVKQSRLVATILEIGKYSVIWLFHVLPTH